MKCAEPEGCVTLTATARAVEGIPHAPGSVKNRSVFAKSAGLPNGPSELRVSSRRHGVSVERRAPGVGAGGVIFADLAHSYQALSGSVTSFGGSGLEGSPRLAFALGARYSEGPD
jgi:hypothetical protein